MCHMQLVNTAYKRIRNFNVNTAHILLNCAIDVAPMMVEPTNGC